MERRRDYRIDYFSNLFPNLIENPIAMINTTLLLTKDIRRSFVMFLTIMNVNNAGRLLINAMIMLII